MEDEKGGRSSWKNTVAKWKKTHRKGWRWWGKKERGGQRKDYGSRVRTWHHVGRGSGLVGGWHISHPSSNPPGVWNGGARPPRWLTGSSLTCRSSFLTLARFPAIKPAAAWECTGTVRIQTLAPTQNTRTRESRVVALNLQHVITMLATFGVKHWLLPCGRWCRISVLTVSRNCKIQWRVKYSNLCNQPLIAQSRPAYQSSLAKWVLE